MGAVQAVDERVDAVVDLLHDMALEVARRSPDSAAKLLVEVLKLAADGGSPCPDLVADAVRLLVVAGRITEAQGLGEAALAGSLPGAARAAVEIGLAEALMHAGRVEAVVARTALLSADLPDRVRVELLALKAHALLCRRDIDAAGRAAASAVELARRCGHGPGGTWARRCPRRASPSGHRRPAWGRSGTATPTSGSRERRPTGSFALPPGQSEEADPVGLLRERLGVDFAIDEVLSVTNWNGHLGVADAYRD